MRETKTRSESIANTWEKVKDLPAYVEAFVPGGLLLLLSGISLVPVVWVLSGGWSVLYSAAAEGKPQPPPQQRGYVHPAGEGTTLPIEGKSRSLKFPEGRPKGVSPCTSHSISPDE